MDAHEYDYEDDYEPEQRSGGSFAETVFLVGALGLIALPAITNIARRWRLRHPHAQEEPSVDKSLKDTFPASDPPASRYFDIPVNRG